MDALTINARINRGDGIAARFLGTTTTIYRPSTPANPIAPENIAGTMLASFNTSAKFDAVKPSLYPSPIYYGLFDRTTTLPGDYLANGETIYFIASQDLNQSTMCVECNATVSFFRPDADGGSNFGALPPGAQTPATDSPMMSGWPASVLIKTRGEAGQALLPGDPKLALFETLLPEWPGCVLRTSDLMTDDDGRRFVLSAVEYSELGIRAYSQLSVA